MRTAAKIFPLLLPLLAACAAPPVNSNAPVPVAPGVALSLPTPAELGRSVDAVQLVTARHGSEVFTFEGRLSVTADAVILVGSDAMGRRAMTLRWSGQALEAERAAWLPSDLRPENILADIMLLYWPEPALRRHLHGGAVSVTSDGHLIRRDGTDVVEVHHQGDPWSGVARLANLAWGYEIEVRSQEIAP